MKERCKRTRGDRTDNESVRAKCFCCAFKSGFPQLICRIKSNLVLALSIILKQIELYEPKHVVVECRCLKIWGLLPFWICSLARVLKWQQVSPIKLELQLAQVNLHTRKDFKSSGIGSLHEK